MRSLLNRMYWWQRSLRIGATIESALVNRRAVVEEGVVVRAGVTIGEDVRLARRSYVSGPGTIVDSADIGPFCSIAAGALIGLGEHPLDWVSTHPAFYSRRFGLIKADDLNRPRARRPVLQADVWVGAGALIRRGVTIGVGAVIGMGSVVLRDVEPYSIVAGVPARHVRFRIDAPLRASLLSSEWWLRSDEDLVRLANSGAFRDPTLIH